MREQAPAPARSSRRHDSADTFGDGLPFYRLQTVARKEGAMPARHAGGADDRRTQRSSLKNSMVGRDRGHAQRRFVVCKRNDEPIGRAANAKMFASTHTLF